MNATYRDADNTVFNDTDQTTLNTYSEVRHFNGLTYIIEGFIKVSEFYKSIFVNTSPFE